MEQKEGELELTIECPQCHHEFELSAALVARLQEQIREDVASETRRQAETGFAQERDGLLEQLRERDTKINEANSRELKLLKEKRQLEEKAANVDLEIERRLEEERKQIESGALARFEEQHKLKDSQKDEHIRKLAARIEELQRQAEQGSQQAQGDAAEVQLEDLLRAAFPVDNLEPVSTGVRGADIIHTVLSPTGDVCGTIIWESKYTKHWNQDWVRKLKDDQLEAKADVAAIVSTSLPDGMTTLGRTNSVWVSSFACAVGLAASLREILIQVAYARSASAGKDQKMELLYDYLAGPEFRQRVEAMAEAFTAMHDDLIREKRAMERIWAKRSKQIDRFVKNVLGMYGDVQGIAGAALPDLPQLELPGAEDDGALLEE